MLDKTFFLKQLDKLVIEYGDKGFTMSKDKASQWYGFMKGISDSAFEKMINQCLMNEVFSPNMATIFKYKPETCPYKDA